MPKVLLKKSSIVGKIPSVNDLDYGELALNYSDRKLYFKDSTNQIRYFLESPSLDYVASNNSTTSRSLTLGGLTLSGTTYSYTFPSTNGTANQVLKTDGSGNLYWADDLQGSGSGGGTGTSGLIVVRDSFTGTGSTFNYTLSTTPLDVNYTIVTINGVQQSTSSYNLTNGNVIQFISAPDNGDIIEVRTLTGDISGGTNDYNELINKPDLSVYQLASTAFSGDYNDLSNRPTLATVATSGSYNDLTNKPLIPVDINDLTDANALLFSGNYNDLTNKPALFSGNYNDLTNKPTIPTNVSELSNDSNYISSTTLGLYVSNAGLSGDYNDLINKPQLANVAGSGDYNDLINKPFIPVDISNLTDTTALLFSGNYNDLTNKPFIPVDINDLTDANALLFSGNYNDLINKPQLANVAGSGDYNDLINKPTIPSSINDLLDVDTSSPSPIPIGNVLKWNGSTWAPAADNIGGGGSETDPIYAASSWYTTTNNSSNWDTAYGWGNHASAGYLTSTSEVTWSQVSGVPTLFSGDYNDLSNKPFIPVDISNLTDTTALLFSGNYNDLTNKPTLVKAAVQWTPYHTLVDGTRYLAGDVVYDNGNIFVANYDNESLPTSNTLYWTDLGPGNRLNIDGRDIPNITYDQLTGKPTIPSKTSDLTNDSNFVNTTQLATKQNTLVSGTNIKTINGQSLLGAGNINISGGGSGLEEYSATAGGATTIVIDSWAASSYSGGKYTIISVNELGYHEITDLLVLHNNSTAVVKVVASDNITGIAGQFSAAISGSDVQISFLGNNTTNLTFTRSLISKVSIPGFTWPEDLETQTMADIDLEIDNYPEKDLN